VRRPLERVTPQLTYVGCGPADDRDLTGICSLADEFGFWAELAQRPASGAGPEAIERGKALTDLYKPLAAAMEDIKCAFFPLPRTVAQ
jgi:hypothetical protein